MPLKLNHVLFLIILKHGIVVISFDGLFGLNWRMLTPCYDYKPGTSSLDAHLVFDL